MQAETAIEAGAVAFLPRVLTQLALPYRNPGAGVELWKRQNGNIHLWVTPSMLIDPKTGATTPGFPYGVLPRHLLIWMASEAFRTKERDLSIGPSMKAFMESLGLNPKHVSRMNDQMRRLFGSVVQIRMVEKGPDGSYIDSGGNFTFVDTFSLWVHNKDRIAPEGTITLSERHFEEIMSSPVPIDIRMVRALSAGGSSMRIDVYVWLTYRLFYMRRDTLIPWESLALQFGGNVGRIRKFREMFVEAIGAVKALWPELRYDVTPSGLLLQRGKPHVEATKKAAIPKRKTTKPARPAIEPPAAR